MNTQDRIYGNCEWVCALECRGVCNYNGHSRGKNAEYRLVTEIQIQGRRKRRWANKKFATPPHQFWFFVGKKVVSSDLFIIYLFTCIEYFITSEKVVKLFFTWLKYILHIYVYIIYWYIRPLWEWFFILSN